MNADNYYCDYMNMQLRRSFSGIFSLLGPSFLFLLLSSAPPEALWSLYIRTPCFRAIKILFLFYW